MNSANSAKVVVAGVANSEAQRLALALRFSKNAYRYSHHRLVLADGRGKLERLASFIMTQVQFGAVGKCEVQQLVKDTSSTLSISC